jgi:tungstate transport system substrate-binding protein
MVRKRLALLLLLLAVPACRQAQDESKDSPDDKAVDITLATTTSTRDTGLLDVLLPKFREETGIEVKVVAVGSGQAMKLGQDGNADVLLTHSPAAEEKFMAAGFGAQRDAVMYNDFIVVGPADDPAEIKGQKSAAAAFVQVADREAPFVSRGDDSGTHRKELDIWKKAGLKPSGAWYLECGQGMAEALRIATEKRAYTLSDRGTFLAHRKRLELVPLVEGDPLLLNRYTVIQLNREKYPHLNHDAARRFAEFLRRTDVQKLIGEFGVAEFGQPLFFPDAK